MLKFSKNSLPDPVPVTRWQGCYEQRWQTRIVPDAFAHPAKMSRALLIRIYNHLLDRALLQRGDTVLDPFVGIGTVAIEGANRGIRVIGVELEPKFVGLARDNVEKYRRYWEGMGYPLPIIVQGDSRKLRQVLDKADVVITSPPYAGSVNQSAGANDAEARLKRKADAGVDISRAINRGGPNSVLNQDQAYGATEGQLGAMVAGQVAAVISSPPYAEIATGAGGLNTKLPQHEGQQAGRSAASASQDTDARYGKTAGQLARLEKGNVDVVLSSPPYENSVDTDNKGGIDWTKTFDGKDHRGAGVGSHGARHETYGSSEGQLGAETGETFWTAAQQVVRECYAVLKPGGIAVWIVKAFVRRKQRVDFPGDWRTLCEHAGFETVEEIHALFAKERTIKGKKVMVERKSFFRRLAENKGSPRIDWEVVWVMRKPGETHA